LQVRVLVPPLRRGVQDLSPSLQIGPKECGHNQPQRESCCVSSLLPSVKLSFSIRLRSAAIIFPAVGAVISSVRGVRPGLIRAFFKIRCYGRCFNRNSLLIFAKRRALGSQIPERGGHASVWSLPGTPQNRYRMRCSSNLGQSAGASTSDWALWLQGRRRDPSDAGGRALATVQRRAGSGVNAMGIRSARVCRWRVALLVADHVRYVGSPDSNLANPTVNRRYHFGRHPIPRCPKPKKP
jgi:hypothetical protein